MTMIPLEANDNDGPAACQRIRATTDAEIRTEQIAELKKQVECATVRLLIIEREREKLRVYIASLTKRLAQAGDRGS